MPTCCAVLVGIAAAGQLKAQDFGIHFLGNTSDPVTGTAGVVPITNWNNIAAGAGSTTITASDGSTTATLALSGGQANNAWDSGLPGDGANMSLMDGYLDAGTYGGSSATVTIGGLTNSHYNVYIYTFPDGSRPQNNGDWLPNYTVNGTTYYVPVIGNSTPSYYNTTATAVGGVGFTGFIQGTPGFANNNNIAVTANFGNYIEIAFVAPVGGVITIEPEKDTLTYRSPFNGIELVPVSGSPPVANSPIEFPPSANVAVEAGVSVSLTATASGSAPIGYQWQTDGGSGSSPTNVSGATSSNLVVNTTGWAPGTYVYDFVAINSLGTNTSPTADIVVVPAYPALPAISVQFSGDGSAQTLSLTNVAGYAPEEFWNVDAAGPGVTYSNLVDYSGAPTVASVTVSYANGRYHSGDNTGTPDDALMSGGFWSGGGYTVNVTGIPYASYNVFVYMLNDHPYRRYGLTLGSQANWGAVFMGSGYSAPPFTLDTQTAELPEPNGSAPGTQMQADLVEFTNITGSSFTITGQTPDGNVAMMGLEIYDAFMGPPVASPISESALGTLYSGLPETLREIPLSGALPLFYQWLTDGGSGNTPTNILGATNGTYSVNTTNLAPGNYNFEVIITNTLGASTSAVLTVTISSSEPVLVSDITASPANEVYVGEPVSFSAGFVGTVPIAYQWTLNTGTGATNIPSSINPSAITPTLILTNPQVANSGTYTLTANNAVGGPVSSSGSTLTVLTNLPPSPSSYAYGAAVLAAGPLAYWPLDDANDPSTGTSPAYDASGNGYYGVYGTNTQNGFNGILGPESPQFPGFPATNGALECTLGTASCFVSASAGTMSASNLTYVAWINPSGPVENWAGILMNRPVNNGFGFGGTVDATGMSELAYTWDTNSVSTWGWDSLLFPIANQWNFVAMVIQPFQATLYLIATNGVVQSTNNVIPHDVEEFGNAWHIGNDFSSGVDDGSRVFPGTISSVGVYLSALSSYQIVKLAYAGLGLTPPVTLTIARAGAGELTLTWPQGTLLQSTSVTGPWTTNAAASSPYTVSPTNSQMYFKVRVK